MYAEDKFKTNKIASTKANLPQDVEGKKIDSNDSKTIKDEVGFKKESNTDIISRVLTLSLIEQIRKIHFDPKAIEKKVSDLIGNEACMFLSVLAAQKGPNIVEYGNQKIKCGGAIIGELTINQLVKKNVLATYIKKEPWANPGVPIPIDKICESVPYAPLFFAKSRKEIGKDACIFKKKVKTSLPFELQFVQAGSLPLTEKLRAAHITFTAKYFKSLGMSFCRRSYNNQERHSKFFVNMEEVMAIINDLETKIVLNPDEVGMTVDKAEQM